ncbi:MAG: SDR family NAD(P)-dependent oxidoreductase [Rhodospirillaceae bacterium]
MAKVDLGPFNGKLAVVTGGGSGIGAAVASELIDQGANVVIGDIQTSIEGVRELDVRNRKSVTAFFRSLERAPDIVITCAGGAPRRAALEVGEALFNETLQLNLGGFWRCTQEAARRAIREQSSLSVVHVASSLYRGPAPELSHFAAAKAASITMLRCLAQELAPQNIRINAVIPGPIETPATEVVWEATPSIRETITAKLPLGRIGSPSDVVPAILWFASEDASWATGSVLAVDGGLDVAP